MATSHVPQERLLLFAQGRLMGEERREVARHLLTLCEECRRTMLSLDSALDDPEQFGASDAAHAITPQGLQAERRDATRLWRESLEWLSSRQRLALVRDEPQFHTRGLQEFLVERARAGASENPNQALDLAQLSLEIVHRLPLDRYRRDDVADLRASSLATVANCKRLLGDLDGSSEAIDQALDALDWGTGDPLEEINVLSMYGSLLTDLGKIEEAVAILASAARDARDIGDRQLEAKLLLQQSSTIGWYEPAAGLDLAGRALELLEGGQGSQLVLMARYQQMILECELGNVKKARSQFEIWRFTFREQKNLAFWHSRYLQLEAALARQEGRLEVCEAFLRQLLTHYVEHDLHLDVALTTLDLAEVLTASRQYEEALDLVHEIVPVLQQWKVSTDVLRACLMVREAIEGRTQEAVSFREAARVLRRSWFPR